MTVVLDSRCGVKIERGVVGIPINLFGSDVDVGFLILEIVGVGETCDRKRKQASVRETYNAWLSPRHNELVSAAVTALLTVPGAGLIASTLGMCYSASHA